MNARQVEIQSAVSYVNRNLERMRKPDDTRDYVEGLGDAWFFLRSQYGAEVDIDPLRARWRRLVGSGHSLSAVDNLASGIYVRYPEANEFATVLRLKDQMPEILGGELVPALNLKGSMRLMGFTTGAEVLTGALIDLSGLDLTTSAPLFSESLRAEYSNSGDKIRLKCVIPAGAHWLSQQSRVRV